MAARTVVRQEKAARIRRRLEKSGEGALRPVEEERRDFIEHDLGRRAGFGGDCIDQRATGLVVIFRIEPEGLPVRKSRPPENLRPGLRRDAGLEVLINRMRNDAQH